MSVLGIYADEGEIEAMIAESERLRADNDALRSTLNEYRTKYWTLHEAVERLFKTIADEKREEGR